MGTIRVVWGSGTGPTGTAAYDAALADAGIHEYNLLTVSSVIPAGPPLAPVGTAPDLGDPGEGLYVVEARATAAPGEADPGVAALGWARAADGPGIFYEADGRNPAAVREAVERGLEHGCGLRPWEPAGREVLLRTVDPDPTDHACVVVCAAYGRSRPLV
jgi:arginine decarboxylase